MRINAINTNAYSPTFKQNDTIVPYPELSYRKSRINVYEADPFESGFKSVFNKVSKAYRLLFTPEVNKQANEIRHNIDQIFSDKKGNKLSTIA